MSIRKFSALWCCFLIMMLPLATASTLRVEEILGEDAIPGVRRSSDQIRATALVLGAEEVDTLAQEIVVRQGSVGRAAFESCAVVGTDSYRCTFNGPQDQKPKGPVNYVITLHPESSQEVSVLARMEVDGEGPAVEQFSVDVQTTNGGPLTVSYALRDTACPNCQKCAGISELALYSAETNRLLHTFSLDGRCSVHGVGQWDSNALPNGVSTLCAVPQDQFDNIRQEYLTSQGISIGENCVEITKDDRAPEVTSVMLTYTGTDIPVDYLGETAGAITIVANVRTQSFPLADHAVRIDLSQLGLASMRIPCRERFTNEYECRAALTGLITQSGQKSITVQVEDTEGNAATETFSTTISLDTVTPTVRSFGTLSHIMREGTQVSVLGRTNNTFIAELDEQGSGFDTNNVQVAIGGTTLRMNCSGNTCRSAPYALSGNPQSLSATLSGADDVGHRFSSGKVFAVDTSVPVLTDLTIANSNLQPFIVQGDDIVVTAKLRDDTGVSGELSTAMFNISADTSLHPSCETNATGTVCQWVLFDVLPTEQLRGSFRFVDAANNVLALHVESFRMLFEQNGEVLTRPEAAISIARNANVTIANFWQPNVEGPMPAFIDEDTARVVEYRAWWNIGFTGGGSARIVDTEFNPAACRGDDIERIADMELVYPNPMDQAKFLTKV